MLPGFFVLGLDVGVSSIGWAVMSCDRNGTATGLLAAGSHLFEAGTEGTNSDIKRGKDTPRGQQRRMARSMRRQKWRRTRRKRQLLRLLQSHGLLPASPTALQRPLDIDAFLKSIDRDLAASWLKNASHADLQRMPYSMRAAATQRRVELFELGRALYHLAQRRGFQSNRRAEAGRREDEDASEVKAAIGDLAERIAAHTPPTLGAYLASLDPDQQRLRSRWTGRAMYEHEFDAIWTEQSRHHPLSDSARAALRRVLFHQRPLKNQKHLIGKCSLIDSEHRVPIASRLYQRFRVLQTVNNIAVAPPGERPRPLSDEERISLIARLMKDGDATFAQARKAAGLPAKTRFNLETGGEKKIIGHRTDAALREALADRFDSLSETEKDRAVEDLRSFRLPEALERRGRRRWGLDAEHARLFSGAALEEGYASLSLAAIRRLLPRLEQGVTFAEARRELFPESYRAQSPLPLLPPVLDSVEDLRNPSVLRALTEVRKLVNEIVRRHGKPAKIRVELARDLKNPRLVRERLTRQNREREESRSEIRARIAREAGVANPSRDDIDKAMLWEECSGICPYTGRSIDFAALFGRTPQFDVEHIWPRSRTLDDSLRNKTLCYHEENRSRKRNRTPFEAYASDRERFEAILERVSRFKGDLFLRREKLRRFQAEQFDADFENRHLSDTRFIARAVADYLAILFGGRADESGSLRVETPTGGLTAWLRTGWGIDRLLGDSPEKNRSDHRHHAIDAIVIALSDPRAVQILARAAEQADRLGKRRAFETIESPFPEFRDQVQQTIDRVIVSHRQSRKVTGALHDQSIYSQRHVDGHRISKELHKLSPAEIRDGRIVDTRALALIREKLESLGKSNPTPQDIAKIFTDPGNAPLVNGHGGSRVRLRRVRVRASVNPETIGRHESQRLVETSSNHHTVIYATMDKRGREVWVDEPVTLLEAYRRQAAKEPIVNRSLGQGKTFVFSLAPNDFVEIDSPNAERAAPREVWRVASVSHGDNELKLHRDARTPDELKRTRSRLRVSGEKLHSLNARKVRVTHLGELRRCGD